MDDTTEYLAELRTLSNEKMNWFNGKALPSMLEQYRLLHTCIKNLYDLLIKRSMITPDPYKLEKKISSIVIPDDSPYIESEKAMVIGSRFSDYESMMDFLCTYFKFSVENLDLAKIKKLTELNNSFQWSNMTLNNSKVNTRGLAALISEVKKNLPQMSLSLISDSISKSSSAITEITKTLKDLSEYKREEYKISVRLTVMSASGFDKSRCTSPAQELGEIKKNFAQTMGKAPFYSELINEIAEEDCGENCLALRQEILDKLKINEKKVVEKKVSVDTKAMLLETLHILTTLSPAYAEITAKLKSNFDVLEGAKNTIWEKIKKLFRRAFNLREKPVIYKLILVDPKKGTKTNREVEINVFISNLERRGLFFGVLANKGTAEYKKIQASTEDLILQFLNKQLTENKEFLKLLEASDDYFKNNAPPLERSKIKGLKIDLITVNNTLVKANQKRAEYVSYIEEVNQMKKLGIKDV